MKRFLVRFAKRAQHDFDNLSPEIARRLGKKLQWYASQENPLRWAERIHNLPPSTYRFKVGDWRIRFYIENKTLVVVRVEHRGSAYRS